MFKVGDRIYVQLTESMATTGILTQVPDIVNDAYVLEGKDGGPVQFRLYYFMARLPDPTTSVPFQ